MGTSAFKDVVTFLLYSMVNSRVAQNTRDSDLCYYENLYRLKANKEKFLYKYL
jgi:hypothetical protein